MDNYEFSYQIIFIYLFIYLLNNLKLFFQFTRNLCMNPHSLPTVRPVEIEQIVYREMTPFTSLPRNTQKGKLTLENMY